MHTKIEDLSIELWLEIFPYLRIHHQFNAFFNLNIRINQILFSYRTYINCKNDDEDTQYLLKYILPDPNNRKNVSVLRLEKPNNMNLSYRIHLFNFPRLTTLILHRVDIQQYALDILKQNLTHLRYLNISSLVSGQKKFTHKFLEMVLSLPKLETCHLRLGISMPPNPLSISSKNSIKYLRLNGINENCITDRIVPLLQYLPNLQSLHIIANQLNFDSPINTKIISSTVPVSIFSLNIKQFTVPLIQFLTFIPTTTPNVQDLTIICRTPLDDLTYLNHQTWISFIHLLPSLKKLTLRFSRSNTIDEQIWNRDYQKLTKWMTKSRIILQLGV